MKLFARTAGLLLIPTLMSTLLGACAPTLSIAPAPPAQPAAQAAAQPIKTSLAVATLAAASAWMVENTKAYGEVEASYLYDDKRGPFGPGLRSRTLLATTVDACRMTVTNTESTWRIDRQGTEVSDQLRVVAFELKDVDARSITAVRLGGYSQDGGYAVNHKYRGSTMEIRFKTLGGAKLFKLSNSAEPTAAQASFMINDSEIGAQTAKALMRLVELCQPSAAANRGAARTN
jgi:hypothetical protein